MMCATRSAGRRIIYARLMPLILRKHSHPMTFAVVATPYRARCLLILSLLRRSRVYVRRCTGIILMFETNFPARI